MPLLTATLRGDLRAAMEAEVRDAARAMRRGVERAGRDVQAELRAEARSGGFTDRGRAIANSWRLSLYPRAAAPRTLRPAALVWSRAPKLVDAFDRGTPITARGQRYLAFPTGYNAAGGRRSASARGGVMVTPAQMRAARGQAFILRSKSNPAVRLWCLRVRAASGIGRRARRLRLFVGPNVEVLGGNRRGQQQRARDILAQGFVPMFFLLRQVRLRKRLDIAAIRRRAPAILARSLAAELGRRA
jgi:hypothetical protein